MPDKPKRQWVAFCGASALWVLNGQTVIGDMIGPFATWADAATWAIGAYPLHGTVAEQRAKMADIIHPIDPPVAAVSVPLGQIVAEGEITPAAKDVFAELREAMEIEHMGLEAEMDAFWDGRPDVPWD
jgi:hypothetical protein